MKTCPKMQLIIQQIAQKHGIDLTQPEANIRLDMPNFDRLCIEVISKNQVAVAHYFEQQGDLMADPEIVFFTGYDTWVPIEITQAPVGVYRHLAELSPDSSTIARASIRGMQEVGSFAETWARNIKHQGWLEDGQRYQRD